MNECYDIEFISLIAFGKILTLALSYAGVRPWVALESSIKMFRHLPLVSTSLTKKFLMYVSLNTSLRLRTHGSGSILDLFSFRSDPYRSRVHSTRTDPTQRSTDVK